VPRVGRPDRTLEPGKLADIVITAVDPLSDIAALQDTSKIMLVMKGGDIVKDLRAVS